MADDCLLGGILDSLEDVGYSGPLVEEGALRAAVEQGLASSHFTDLCLSLCSELKAVCGLQESVSRPTGPEDADSFQLEMRALLAELGCPHSTLTEGMALLDAFSSRLLLVDFLLSELLAARLVRLRREEEPTAVGLQDGQYLPYSVAGNLAAILKVYGLSEPPPHIPAVQVLDKIIQKTKEVVSQAPKGHLTARLVISDLSEEQWATLDRINDTLTKEYATRRQMLLTRCDVTVQSFRWSDHLKVKEDEFTGEYQSRREQLRPSAPVGVARVLAAGGELLSVQKTSSGVARTGTQCAINRVLIGQVPDRGGRPRETRPPSGMPSFKQRTAAPQERRDGGHRGGRGKGGGRRGGGGRVQGGWSGGQGGGRGGGGWQQGGHHGNYGGGGAQRGKQQYYYS